MSKIFKRPGRDYYYYRSYRGGEETLVCTFETDKKNAQAQADGHAQAVRGKFGVDELFNMLMGKLEAIPKADRDKRRAEYGNRLLRFQDEKLPIVQAWDRWLKMPNKSKQGGNPSKNTLRGYSAIWRRFEKWATAQKVEHLHELTALQAQNYMADLWASGVSERTYGAHLKFLRSLFKVLKLQAGLVDNPFEDIPVMELQTVSKEAFTAEELKTICSKASGDWRYLVGIGLYTGLRLVDAVHLKWENISDRIRVIPRKTSRRKKGKKREVEIMLHAALERLLDDLRRQRGGNPSGYLFPKIVALYAKSPQEVSFAFRDFLTEDCKIETRAEAEEGDHRKRRASLRGFHSLRHSFVSLCAMSGVPQATTQKLVGHSTAEMTQLYSHTTDEEQKKAINLLPADFF